MNSGLVLAQNPDDPMLDQVPSYLRKQLPSSSVFPASGNVITINNWDNFGLGIDFGESNMASHLANPTWFFHCIQHQWNASYRERN